MEGLYDLDYYFLDDAISSLYTSEYSMSRVFRFFTFLAVFISCLGILGLASFSAESRAKEIGIRKVLGASVTGVVGLLSRDFLKLIVLANIFAWPAAYFVLNRWLITFPYRINMGLWMFVLSAVMALIVTLLTVSYQSIKAALANPVDSFRYE